LQRLQQLRAMIAFEMPGVAQEIPVEALRAAGPQIGAHAPVVA